MSASWDPNKEQIDFAQRKLMAPIIDPRHYTTKEYVDQTTWPSVNLATLADLTVSDWDGLSFSTTVDTIDGVEFVVGDRILVKDQIDQTQNGIYVVESISSGTAVFERDVDASRVHQFVQGKRVAVTDGTANINSSFILVSKAPASWADVITFISFSSGFSGTEAVIIEGDGIATEFPITHSLNTMNVSVGAYEITDTGLEEVIVGVFIPDTTQVVIKASGVVLQDDEKLLILLRK